MSIYRKGDEGLEEWLRNPSDELALKKGCYFDDSAGLKVCRFLETFCRQSKDKWRGTPIELMPWQRDWIMRLYGWRREDGRRRFRLFYLEIPKKNGKSTLLSGLALYHLVADGQNAPEVYCLAYDKSQASIVFTEAARMVASSPELKKRLKTVKSLKELNHPAQNGIVKALSADVPSKDGVSASFVIFDELHRQKDTKLWDIYEYAGASRSEPLMGSITTAGVDRQSICYQQRKHAEDVNAGLSQDWEFLGVIYAADPDDDITDPEVWRKANPSMGYTISEEDFASELARALETPSKLNSFKRLRFCIWTEATERFIAQETWDKCRVPARKEADLCGLRCWFGGDLSATVDLTAVCRLYVIGSDERGPRYYAAFDFWAPEDTAEHRQNVDRVGYVTWADQGFIDLTPGGAVDYGAVRARVNDAAKDVDLRKIMLDPWNALQLAIQLRDEDGLKVDMIRQGYASISAPTKELERLTVTGRIEIESNPVIDWMAANAVTERDAAGNIKLSKKHSREKIDGMYALVNAVAGAISDPDGECNASDLFVAL